MSQPFKTIQQTAPGSIHAFLKNPSPQTEQNLKNEIGDLLVATRSTMMLVLLGGLTGFVSSLARSKRRSFLSYLFFAIELLGVSVVTIIVSTFLSSQFGPFFVDTTRYDFSSPVVLTTILAVFLIIDFWVVLEEIQNPFWERVGTGGLKFARLLGEFTLLDRVGDFVDYSVWKARFRDALASDVQCTDDTSLTKIFERTLKNQVGPPIILKYRAEELYPPNLMKRLSSPDKVKTLIRYLKPVTFVGIDKDRKACVLVATVQKGADRRMTLWTVSPSVTKNIVTICTNANRDILGPLGAH